MPVAVWDEVSELVAVWLPVPVDDEEGVAVWLGDGVTVIVLLGVGDLVRGLVGVWGGVLVLVWLCDIDLVEDGVRELLGVGATPITRTLSTSRCES